MSKTNQNPTQALARHLRANLTDAERLIWGKIRRRQLNGLRFRSQCPIGPYVVDFVCFEFRLVVEVDGGQHVERAEYDHDRDNWLCSQGFRVLRYWNHDVLGNIDAVLEQILHHALHPLPYPPP